MMILEKHQIWFAVAIIAAVIILAALGHAYVAALLDKSKADQLHEDMQTQILALRSDLQKQIASIDKDSKIKDPIQIALKVPDYQPGVRPTIVIPGGVPTQQAATAGQIPVEQVTHPEDVPVGSLVIKPDQIPSYWQSVTQCAKDQLGLAVCQKELALTEKDRDNFKNLSNGGNVFQRIKRNAKWLAIGTAAGAAIGYAAHR